MSGRPPCPSCGSCDIGAEGRRGVSRRWRCRTCGRCYSTPITAESDAAAARPTPPASASAPAPTPELDALEEHRLRAQIRNSGRERRDLLERLSNAEAQYELIAQLAQQRREPLPIIAREKGPIHEGAAVLLCSDWHVEEQVSLDETNGRNEFNPAIAEARVRRLVDGFLWLYHLHHGSKFHVRDIVVAFIGDMITGWIHDELMATNAMAPPPAILFFEDLARYLLKRIATETGARIHVIGVPGNHGRLTKKRPVKEKGKASLEWVAYSHLGRWVRDNIPDAEVHLAPGTMVYQDVLGSTIRYIHGDQIGYQGGIGGIGIPLNKKILRWDSDRRASLTCLGHFHTWTPSPNYQINGSLIGYSEFANWIAAPYEPAMQSFILVDSRYGPCARWPIYCEGDNGTDPRRSPEE